MTQEIYIKESQIQKKCTVSNICRYNTYAIALLLLDTKLTPVFFTELTE